MAIVHQLESLVANTNEKASRIGWLYWYLIAETPTDRTLAVEAFRKSGLPEGYKFPQIRSVDAYRRASSSIDKKRIDLPGGLVATLMVRDVGSKRNKDEVVRHVVVELNNGVQLDYVKESAMLRYDRNYETVDSAIHNWEPYVVDAVRAFERNYQVCLHTYDGAAKRRVVRNVLNDLAAASLKESGGVYLVPRQNEELLFQLVSFVNALPNCKAYKMPVEDTAEARDMVRDVVTHKAESTLSEIRAALKSEAMDEKTIQDLIAKARQVRKEVALYQDILKDSIGTLDTDAELLEAQMFNLFERI